MVTDSKLGFLGKGTGGATVYTSLTFDDTAQAEAFEFDLIEVVKKHLVAAKKPESVPAPAGP